MTDFSENKFKGQAAKLAIVCYPDGKLEIGHQNFISIAHVLQTLADTMAAIQNQITKEKPALIHPNGVLPFDPFKLKN